MRFGEDYREVVMGATLMMIGPKQGTAKLSPWTAFNGLRKLNCPK